MILWFRFTGQKNWEMKNLMLSIIIASLLWITFFVAGVFLSFFWYGQITFFIIIYIIDHFDKQEESSEKSA